jgi:hypothetical protein
MTKTLLASFAFGAALLIVGCVDENGVGNTSEAAPTENMIEAEIKRIEDNPNMPQQAKDMAIASLKRNGTGQKGMGSNQPANK